MRLENEIRGAKLSPCKRYRYYISRIWDPSPESGYVLFIGLNPSTADHTKDDATVRRWRSLAKEWGYGGFYAINLYAFRATKQTELWKAEDPVGAKTNFWIEVIMKRCVYALACWGVGDRMKRGPKVARLLSKRFMEIHCLTKTNEGHPHHPLRLSKSLQPVIWHQFA
jgi:hypothetical protein